MKVEELLKNGQPLIVMTLADLREFMKEVVDNTLREISEINTNEEVYLTPKEVCKILNVHRMTLQAWKNRGYLVPAMVGGKCLYKELDIKQLLNNK